MHQEQDHLFKLLLIGNSSVGKSNLILRYSEDAFIHPWIPTIGADFKIRTIEENGSILTLQIWDISGQERFRVITTPYYKSAHGIMVVYDITDRQSFQDIQTWIEKIQKYGNQSVIKLLIGNKADLQAYRQVQIEEGMALAESLGIKFLETSAKTSSNVTDAFMILANEIKQKMQYQYQGDGANC